MSIKPKDFKGPTIHYSWDRKERFCCPLCGRRIRYKYNDGGSINKTLEGEKWIVKNFYACVNPDCFLHKPFSVAPVNILPKKHFALDVWEVVIREHFKYKQSYPLIKERLEKEYELNISKNTVRAICQFFSIAGSALVDEETVRAVKKNGAIFLSLDGAKGEDGGPSLWMFSDRLTGRVLLPRLLDHAKADVLGAIFREIEILYGVPIIGVISDRQDSIVVAVERHLPGIPHAFCHFHFLKNLAKPVATKDSKLQDLLQKRIRRSSLMREARFPPLGHSMTSGESVHVLLNPLAEEIKCALAARGDGLKVFPGLETYANLRDILSRLEPFLCWELPTRVLTSLRAITRTLREVLEDTKQLHDEVEALVRDLTGARETLAHRKWSGKRVKGKFKNWVKMLRSRLRRRGMVNDPKHLKYNRCPVMTPPEEVWQEWVRLYSTHEAGLFVSYDNEAFDFTNNPKEWLFRAGRGFFRALFGRGNVDQSFTVHAGNYLRIAGLDFTSAVIREVLLGMEQERMKEALREISSQTKRVRRLWRIREHPTGNFEQLEANLGVFL